MNKFTAFINVAEHFTVYPGGRTREEGGGSAEEFLELIKHSLSICDKVIIDLDGTRGYGSSFLNEVACNLTEEDCKHILFICSRNIYIKELTSFNNNIMVRKKQHAEEVEWSNIMKRYEVDKYLYTADETIYHS